VQQLSDTAGLPNFTKSPPTDIRLGDVFVGVSDQRGPGLVAYELGRENNDGFELLRGGQLLANTETTVLSAIRSIKTRTRKAPELLLQYYESIENKEHDDGTFADPGQELDTLHAIGDKGKEYTVSRALRPDDKRTQV
jgi:hypothetical protein